MDAVYAFTDQTALIIRITCPWNIKKPDADCTVGVPNAPKSCIAEIFSADASTGSPVKNGNLRPRTVRDTPTRPRDTHSRLFGQKATKGKIQKTGSSVSPQ
ncbi:hypothetical protein MSG28_011910 [Choristoneura fumiferana]|uniref:Uncharacterized protein n=1 Tax=Choristoneura fumiferana TaxID=7141 RepID=A0ACC0KN02_CHOFU|nr:hypothetical protein MSG28_011910 [Choristoneura fumiferana]